MKKFTFAYMLWSVILLVFFSPILSAQEEASPEEAEPVDTYLSLLATYTSNDTVVLLASLYIRHGRERIDLQNAQIIFTASGEKDQVEVGRAFTDSTGSAHIKVPLLNPALPADAEGMITYTADFEGTDNYLSASEQFISKPARLEVSFYEEDSVRYIRVNAQQHAGDAMEPITGETVFLFVPTLFRPLPIGEVSLDEEGTGSIEFPMSLIGDSLGNITIVARIDENDRFGYVRGENTCSWAIPKHLFSQDKPTRELWTPVAPIWMIITLLTLLAGVWGHYIYAVTELIKIKKSASKEKSEEKDWSNYS